MEISHKKPLRAFTQREAIFESITGEKSKESISPDGMNINIEKKKTTITIRNNKTSFFIEGIESEKQANTFATYLFNKTKRALDWSEIQRVGIRTFWISPVRINFFELVRRFKERFFNPDNIIVQNSVDVCALLDFKDNERIATYRVGPMEKTQLEQRFMIFKKGGDFPDQFIFVDVDLGFVDAEANDDIDDMLRTAINFSKNKALQTDKILNK